MLPVFKFSTLVESRRNPEQNPKLSLYKQLSKYLGSDHIYVSFRSRNRLGINPSVKFDENLTPLGIYAYSLEYFWMRYGEKETLKDELKSGDPEDNFAMDRPFVYVISPVGNFIEDTAEYDKLEEDLAQLESEYSNTLMEIFLRRVDEEKAKRHHDEVLKHQRKADDPSDFGRLWYATGWIAKLVGSAEGRDVGVVWNEVFRKRLGYSGLYDSMEVIHPNEPMQALFFSMDGLEVLEMIHNTEAPEDAKRKVFHNDK